MRTFPLPVLFLLVSFPLAGMAQTSREDAIREIDAKIAALQQEKAMLMGPVPSGGNPLFESNDDDVAFKYNSVSDKYPTNPDNFGFDALRNNMSATHIGLLTSLKDPRVFVVAEPGTYYTDTLGLSRTDFNAYVGAPFDEGLFGKAGFGDGKILVVDGGGASGTHGRREHARSEKANGGQTSQAIWNWRGP